MSEPIPHEILDRLAARFRLLADESRLAILRCLIPGSERSVGEVASAAGLSPPNVSKHLKLLAEEGVLSRRKEGLQVFYRLEDPVVEEVCRLMSTSILNGPGK
jgi:DNA-binding transcriptional ArsR family regulator